MSSVNYSKQFTGLITSAITIIRYYIYKFSGCCEYCNVMMSLYTHVLRPSHLSGVWDSLSTEEVIVPQVTGRNTRILFFPTQPGCFFPHTFYFPDSSF